MLLLTDGMANRGITEPDRLSGLAGDAARRGIVTTAIGVGDRFEEDLLSVLADAGQGNTYWAAEADEVASAFEREFDGLASVVAQNLSVEIRPSADVRVVGILNEFRSVAVDDGVQVALGDAYAAERRTMVAALAVPGLATLGPVVIAEVVLRYTLVGDQVSMHTVTVPVTVNVADAAAADAAGLSAQVTEEVLVLRAASARQRARRRVNDGEVAEARRVLDEVAGELRSRAGEAAEPDRILAEADEIDRTAAELSETAADFMVSKRMWAAERTYRRGRTSRPGE